MPKQHKKNVPKSSKGPERLSKLIQKKDKARAGKKTSYLNIDANSIKNKERRKEIVRKQKLEAKKLKRLQKLKEKHIRATQGEEAMPKEVPRTIESLRVIDETYIKEEDKEVAKDEEMDEFANYFNEKITPKLLVTTCRNPKSKLFAFMKEMQQAIPEFYYYPRKNFHVLHLC